MNDLFVMCEALYESIIWRVICYRLRLFRFLRNSKYGNFIYSDLSQEYGYKQNHEEMSTVLEF